MKRCEVCKENASKYRCPKCEVETCCLSCVNQHKSKTSCDGQRDKTAHVKLSEFSDRHLLSDYRFLEEAGRKNNNAGRDSLKRKHNKPNFLRELEKQAGNRNIDLRFMPYPMSRRKNNSLTYQHKLKKMFWQIEWVFPEADLTLTDKRICEDESLESVLNRHTGVDSEPLVKHKVKPYITAGNDQWTLFMKQENTAGPQRYYKIDMKKSLVENFRHKVILEYPVIHVVLPSKCSQYDTVPEDVRQNDESSKGTLDCSQNSSENKGTLDCMQDGLEKKGTLDCMQDGLEKKGTLDCMQDGIEKDTLYCTEDSLENKDTLDCTLESTSNNDILDCKENSLEHIQMSTMETVT